MVAYAAFSTGNSALGVLGSVWAFSAGGPAAVAAATMLRVLPGGVLGLFMAVLATSRRPQLHLAVGIGARGLVAIAIIVAISGDASVGVVLALLAADSLVSAAVRPLHGSLVVRLADRMEEAEAGNAATSSLRSAAMLAGPALAGLALGAVGVAWSLALPVVTFVVATAAALRIRTPRADDRLEHPRSSRSWVRAQLIAVGAGFCGIAASRPAVAATAMFLVTMMLDTFWFVASVSVAEVQLGLGAEGATLIIVLFGAGGLVGALATLSIIGRRGLPRAVAGAMFTSAVVLAVMGLIERPLPGLMLSAGVGAACAVAYGTVPTLVHRSVAATAMAPAAATLQGLTLVGVGTGATMAALLIDSVGLTVTLALVGAVTVAATVLAWPQLRRADVLSVEDSQKLTLMRTTAVLAPLPMLALEQLARAAKHLAVPAGTEVIRQGEIGDRFYIIAAGRADVVLGGIPVGTLGPGGSFGETAALRDEPRRVTVTAREDLDLVTIDRAEFLAALSADPGALGRIGGAERTRSGGPSVEGALVELDGDTALGHRPVNELLAEQPLLSVIAADELRELARSARVVAAPADALVVREGDYGEAYYVIIDGAVRVFRGESPVGDLGPGDGFGEHALLRNIPRIATVRALVDTTLIAVDRGMLQRAVRGRGGTG